jgi:chitinase
MRGIPAASRRGRRRAGRRTAAPTAAQAHQQKSYVKVGYFTQWGIYGRDFQLSKVQSPAPRPG